MVIRQWLVRRREQALDDLTEVRRTQDENQAAYLAGGDRSLLVAQVKAMFEEPAAQRRLDRADRALDLWTLGGRW
jgi:primosomal protein N''